MSGMSLAVEGRAVRQPMSYEDYLALGETLHHEYYDGACVVNPPAARHVLVARRLTRALEDAGRPAGLEVMPEWGWHLSDPSEDFEPDIMVVPASAAKGERLLEPPLLVVEVTSPSTRTVDHSRKVRAYARGGASWYWIVDPEARQLTVMGLRRGRLVKVAEATDSYTTTEPLVVSLELGSIFA